MSLVELAKILCGGLFFYMDISSRAGSLECVKMLFSSFQDSNIGVLP